MTGLLSSPRAWAPGLATLTLALLLAAPADAAVRRFALVAGANDGGTERVRLRYAATDAQSFHRVLAELGGVATSDSLLVLEPSRQDLLDAFATLRKRVSRARRSGDRIEVVLYYSGHSDEGGLLPSGQQVTWREVRRKLDGVPADVRIAIVDSCASGALLRSKGGVRRAPFLVDDSSEVKGHAYLTSSSADEVAQESDRIGASFFTHHLVSGLRGAADSSRDSRVTLSEAYQHAFHETLASSERTHKGPQHPNYDIDLAGSGDVVITDLRTTVSSLILSGELEGRLFIRDPEDHLVVELAKTVGHDVELGLAAGRYHLSLHDGTSVYATEVALGAGATARMERRVFVRQEVEVARARGSAGPDPEDIYLEEEEVLIEEELEILEEELGEQGEIREGAEPEPDEPRPIPLRISLLPYVGVGSPASHEDVISPFSFNIIGGVARRVEGVELGSVFNITTERFRGLQMAGVTNIVRGPFQGAQMAGVLNVVRGPMQGAQLAGVANVASRVEGYQGAGIANIAQTVDGAQISLFNVAKEVDGVQLGLLNFADHVDGTSIGLLSVVGNGWRELGVYTTDITALNVSYKIGGPNVYTIFTFGGNSELRTPEWVGGLGFGGHIPLGRRWYLDLDAWAGTTSEAQAIEDKKGAVLLEARANLGLQLGPLHLFGGPIWNTSIGFDDNVEAVSGFGRGEVRQAMGGAAVRSWPGFMVGIGL